MLGWMAVGSAPGGRSDPGRTGVPRTGGGPGPRACPAPAGPDSRDAAAGRRGPSVMDSPRATTEAVRGAVPETLTPLGKYQAQTGVGHRAARVRPLRGAATERRLPWPSAELAGRAQPLPTSPSGIGTRLAFPKNGTAGRRSPACRQGLPGSHPAWWAGVRSGPVPGGGRSSRGRGRPGSPSARSVRRGPRWRHRWPAGRRRDRDAVVAVADEHMAPGCRVCECRPPRGR